MHIYTNSIHLLPKALISLIRALFATVFPRVANFPEPVGMVATEALRQTRVDAKRMSRRYQRAAEERRPLCESLTGSELTLGRVAF